jgi:hypothetical protein
LARLHLDAPWTLFYAILVVMGVTNYLPTRYGVAAAASGLAFSLEFVGLSHSDWPAGRRAIVWSWVSWSMSLGIWLARWSERRGPVGRDECERVWFWFRDHWGVVWALRVAERFNRTAALAHWPIRLHWFGVEPATTVPPEDRPAVPADAAVTLRSLLRRFARPERLDRAAAGGR